VPNIFLLLTGCTKLIVTVRKKIQCCDWLPNDCISILQEIYTSAIQTDKLQDSLIFPYLEIFIIAKIK